jgi:uncharacterized protein (TIGR00730 family)
MSDKPRPPVKAYRNAPFIDSRAGRPMRILAEYLEPASRFDRYGVIDTIVFFGSARIGPPEAAEAAMAAAQAGNGDLQRAEGLQKLARYYESARELSRRLTEWSLGLASDPGRYLVCTGGGPGIMEAANRGAAEAGGKNIGLTISIPVEEFENPYVTPELAFEFHYFFMRKFWFTYLAKAVVVMPGGFGTMDELFELLTLMQTLKMKKRLPVVLFGSDYWDEVVDLEAMVRYGTINAEDLELFHRTDSVAEAFDFLTRTLTEGQPPRGAVL